MQLAVFNQTVCDRNIVQCFANQKHINSSTPRVSKKGSFEALKATFWLPSRGNAAKLSKSFLNSFV